MSDAELMELRKTANRGNAIWADEGGLQLTLTHMTGNRVVVAIVDAVNDKQLAAVTIANYRVKRIADFAAAVSSLHNAVVADASRLDQQEKQT